jgi:hypothetical protein
MALTWIALVVLGGGLLLVIALIVAFVFIFGTRK